MAGATDAGWLIPDLSLPTQLEMERDRRAAARMTRDELHIKADDLIVSWYQQQEMINRLLGRVRHLEVELAISR